MLIDLIVVAAVLGACVFAARGTRWAPAIECAVPVLALALLVTQNHLVLGIIMAAAFAGAALATRELWILAVAGVLLLRWIPLRDVEVWRELVVLGGAVALFFALRRPTILALLATLGVAAVTPVHPGKAAVFPLAVAALCLVWDEWHPLMAAALIGATFFVRWSLAGIFVAAAFALLIPFLDLLKPLAYAAGLALFALWPWSGVVARALPVFTRFEEPIAAPQGIGWALARGASKTLAIPRTTHLVVNASAANAAALPPGRLLGFIDAGNCTRQVRVGDVADFGFTRRQHFFAARNPLPRVTRADIRGYGATSWVHGAGAVGVACVDPFTSLRFRAADDLPADARLQIESIELPAR